MRVYKWTKADLTTLHGFQYQVGVAAKASGKGRVWRICTAGWLHAYPDYYLAELLRHSYMPVSYNRLWEAEGSGKKIILSDKIGFTSLTLIREIDPPTITEAQRMKFGILCALEVCDDAGFVRWARQWLDGTDRTPNTARRMQQEAMTARCAVRAVEAAIGSYIWDFRTEGYTPVCVEQNVAEAAEEAAYVSGHTIDLIKLAHEAMRED